MGQAARVAGLRPSPSSAYLLQPNGGAVTVEHGLQCEDGATRDAGVRRLREPRGVAGMGAKGGQKKNKSPSPRPTNAAVVVLLLLRTQRDGLAVQADGLLEPPGAVRPATAVSRRGRIPRQLALLAACARRGRE